MSVRSTGLSLLRAAPSAIALAMALGGCMGGCNPLGTNDSSSPSGGGGGPVNTPTLTPTPVPAGVQGLWRYGSCGTWFGAAFTCPSTNDSMYTIAVTDNVTGDLQTLRSDFSGAMGGGFYFQCPVTRSAGAYFAAGHVEFNLRLERPASDFNPIQVSYGAVYGAECATCTSCTSFYSLPVAGLTTTAFTHVSVPFSAFSMDCTGAVNRPLELGISLTFPQSGPIFTINDIRWTSF